ncbi:MAG: L-histidine N(alpha)-methyltransferase [Pseudomonadota bacterium]
MTGQKSIQFSDFHPTPSDIEKDILQGLSAPQKQIPPKYFYDEKGSAYFEQICQLPEYYLTRTEIGLLKRYGEDIADLIGPHPVLLELGSGSSLKIRLLLEALHPSLYLPMDISKNHLLQSANALAADYPWLDIHALCVDYSQNLNLPTQEPGFRRIAFFPGSSIGNFDPHDAVGLLQRIRRMISPDGGLLIGVDLIKDTAVLEAAYNDEHGITAAFNKNLLIRLNRDLNADFVVDRFRHKAFYNDRRHRIEMHLESDRKQVVSVAGTNVPFRHGETIHTENSYKYSIAGFQRLVTEAGFRPVKVWTDPDHFFSLHYLANTDEYYHSKNTVTKFPLPLGEG